MEPRTDFDAAQGSDQQTANQGATSLSDVSSLTVSNCCLNGSLVCLHPESLEERKLIGFSKMKFSTCISFLSVLLLS